MSIPRIALRLALAIGLAAFIASISLRAADPQPAGKADKDNAKADESTPDKPEETKDRYRVPDGGVKELLAFIKEIGTFRPKTQEEAAERRAKGLTAMKEAAEKIQQLATDEDKSLDGYHDAIAILLYARASESGGAGPEERKKLFNDIKANLAAANKPSQYAMAAGMQLASSLEQGAKPRQAIEVYRELGEILSKSPHEDWAKIGAKMEGAARRLDLVGQPLELSGTQMNGDKFDWSKYRGKVVLVDFWATWCGPCLAELPNVKRNYERYHDKGFEVVGVSLDSERAALDKFLDKEQIPWTTLNDGGWEDNAVATYYGIMGIPTVFLVDKEGNVVSTDAHGPTLSKLLRKLLGPPATVDKPEKSDSQETTEESSDGASK